MYITKERKAMRLQIRKPRIYRTLTEQSAIFRCDNRCVLVCMHMIIFLGFKVQGLSSSICHKNTDTKHLSITKQQTYYKSLSTPLL